jgi:hypothetical protein
MKAHRPVAFSGMAGEAICCPDGATPRYGLLGLDRRAAGPKIPVPSGPWNRKSIPTASNALRMLVNVSAYGTERSDSNRAIDVCETPDRAERSSWLQESHARAART